MSKLRSARKLLSSKWYVLITDRESVIDLDLRGMKPVVILHAVSTIKSQLNKLVEKVEVKLGKPKSSGQKTAETNIRKFGKDFYSKIGKEGGSARVPKGFAKNIGLAKSAGAVGGARSKRTKKDRST